MKTTIYLACMMALLHVACTNSSTPAEDAVAEGKKLIPRNTSITRSNSYSDLFTDSSSVEKFITQQKLNDTIANQLRNFYNARNFQLAWFASDGLTEQALAFRNKYEYDQDTAFEKKSLDRRLDRYMLDDSAVLSASDPSVVKTELLNTWRFIRYIADEHTVTRGNENEFIEFVPAQKQKVLDMAQAVLKDGRDDNYHPYYQQLKKKLQTYLNIQQSGGWPKVSLPSKKQKTGDSTLKVFKKRLQAIQLLQASDTTPAITTEFTEAIKKLQASYGETVTGNVNKSLVDKLNVPVTNRIEQILLNMERMRWMPAQAKGELIMVNIPSFVLTFWEGDKKAFDMDIVVGKEGHSTVMFSGNLNQVVFSPYWNIPPSIVEKEVMPDMQENPAYLEENNMEITGEEDGLPVIRQLPGEDNALGRVKFLFPNSFNIYFHDTPEKALFKKAKRAYSHGCIRLSDPVKMANYLLKDQSEWTAEKIDSAMHAEKEKYVKVKDPVPVLIYYFTSWVNEEGILQFRDDIYSHDKKLAKKLFFASE